MTAPSYFPSALWPVDWPCTEDVMVASPVVTGKAVSFASTVMWALTGRQFGLNTVKLRPCRDFPLDTPFPDAWISWPGTQRPPLYATTITGGDWLWFPAGCGSCQGSCTCGTLNRVKLPAPVYTIDSVMVDGVQLATSAYQLEMARYVRRIDGSTWPTSNDLTLPDTAVGTWSITADYGQPPPANASLAVGELACEYLRAFNGQDCRLPRTVTQLARQGTTITLPDLSAMLQQGSTGYPMVDMVIAAYNPGHLRQRARVYSVDKPPHTWIA